MMKYVTTFSIITALTVITTAAIFCSRLKQETIDLIGLAIAASVVIAIAGFFCLAFPIAKQKYRGIKAQTDAMVAEARQKEYLLTTDGYGMSHLINVSNGHSQNLTIDARAYRNGHYEPPTSSEVDTLRSILAAKHASTSKMLIEQSMPVQLPAPQLDFYTAMSDPLQAYAIIGPQRIGKSLLAQRLAQHLTNLGRVCLIIGTKAEPAEWQNCKRFIGNDNVATALNNVLQELVRRLSVNSKLPPLAVFLDDWINSTVLDSDLCERFFVEASTRFLTAGIVPYFLLQSDSKVDWGTKHGAALKNNFVHLALSAPRINGHLDHSQLKAAIVYPGDKEHHQVRLPGGMPMLAEPVIIQPSDDDQEIINLAASGLSYKEVTEAVYGPGKYGKFYNDKIDKVLARYGLRIAPRIS